MRDIKRKMGRLGIGAAVLACVLFSLAFQFVPTYINGTPPPYTFTGTGVSQSGQTFTFNAGTGSVTSFAAPSGSWPTWLVPTVTNPTTTPSLAVAAGQIPISAVGSAGLSGTGPMSIASTGVISCANGTNAATGCLEGDGTTISVTSGIATAINLSGTPALPNGTTATTQAAGDNSTKLATDAFVVATAPVIVAKVDLTGQTANIGSTTAYAIPAGKAGSYLITCYVVLTTVATTSTLPTCNVSATDEDTGQPVHNSGGSATLQMGTTSSQNTAGSTGIQNTLLPSVVVRAAQSTNITYQTLSYASSPATTMQYALHLVIMYLGA